MKNGFSQRRRSLNFEVGFFAVPISCMCATLRKDVIAAVSNYVSTSAAGYLERLGMFGIYLRKIAARYLHLPYQMCGLLSRFSRPLPVVAWSLFDTHSRERVCVLLETIRHLQHQQHQRGRAALRMAQRGKRCSRRKWCRSRRK